MRKLIEFWGNETECNNQKASWKKSATSEEKRIFEMGVK